MNSGIALVGIATAMAIVPGLPQYWREGEYDAPLLRQGNWKNKAIAATAHMAAVKYQLQRLSRHRAARPPPRGAAAGLAAVGVADGATDGETAG